MDKETEIYDWILRMLKEGKVEEVGKRYPTIEVYTKPRLIYVLCDSIGMLKCLVDKEKRHAECSVLEDLDDYVGELFEVLFIMAKFGVAKLHEPPEETSKA